MFGWGKSKKKAQNAVKPQPTDNAVEQEVVEQAPQPTTEVTEQASQEAPLENPVQAVEPSKAVTEEQNKEAEPAAKTGFFARIKAGLSRTRSGLADGLGDLLLGKKEIDDDLLEDIETQLLMADIGVAATQDIINDLTARASRKELKDSGALYEALKVSLTELLEPCHAPLEIPQSDTPFVILMVGVNGVGKTTTIGKMAKRFQAQGKSVMLAAGDTFRAAAVEQLQTWGERNNVQVVAQHTGADSASVIFDAVQSAKAKKVDVLIADTAGRLQNKAHLMQELEKVVRVMKKIDESAPHEVMLVLDAGTGQNALSQAKLFQQAVGVNSISLSKLDGTAKGGVIFAIAKELALPVRFIGVGEQIDDLRPFDREQFINALFADD
ncbi:MAG: signal recognition particle-docking protein FtsY [Bermanella sp.]|nr:signal recognition particle-docking protein FtsY [Bermanella sp.]